MILINADNQVKMAEVEREHLKYFKTKIIRKLSFKIGIKHGRNKPFYTYLRDYIDDILIGKPQRLDQIAKEIKGSYGVAFEDKSSRKTVLYRELLQIFNYNTFVTSYPPAKWGAYQLVSKLNVKVCPYCNRQYTFMVISDDPAYKGKTRARLDHFYDKATYPYLATSLYNLIPCCSICNSDLKGTEDFTIDTHLNPYVDEFGQYFKFGIDMVDKSKLEPGVTSRIDYLFGKGEEFEIVIRDKCTDPVLRQKVENNLQVFKIKELYNHHKDHVLDLIRKKVVYTESQIDELYSLYSGRLFSSREDVIQMITSNYVGHENLDKKVLAKITQDICEELELYIL
ncbi:hypothetical protein EHV15_31635 [Paenibacillus oralis]|uniref:HNH endonuclease n=1 Tax=Paenibacillus oralis TaxID=2490856 RepID=A0A3P3UEU6_9BACL|nr:hypothetical protein [Paenibacillus oralis]RRJ66973.1 hypothetical protein EHV15_31635 [Paenibacillus oralis]